LSLRNDPLLRVFISDLFSPAGAVALPQLLNKKRKIALFDALEKVKSGKRLNCILF
jgi:hypothetical protein